LYIDILKEMGSLGTLIATRNLFLNTEDPVLGECRDIRLNLPQNLVMCNENQHMRVTLNSFTMRNSWYRVNQYNSVIYMTCRYAATSGPAGNRIVAVKYASKTDTNPVVATGDTVLYNGNTGVFKTYVDATNTLIFELNAGDRVPHAGETVTFELAGAPGTSRGSMVVGQNPGSQVYGQRVQISLGNYTSFEDLTSGDGTGGAPSGLRKAIHDLLGTGAHQWGGWTIAANGVTWNRTTNKITVALTAPTNPIFPLNQYQASIKFVCLTINPQNTNVHSFVNDMIGTINTTNQYDHFQNSYELYGGCFVKEDPGKDATLATTAPERNATVPSFEDQWDSLRSLFVIDGLLHTSSFNATLQTEENIYLRTDLHNSSFQTAGFDSGNLRAPQVIASRILAKIPLNNPTFAITKTDEAQPVVSNYERPYELIKYIDNGNSMYSILLTSKKISTMRLYITDSFGRLWPEISQAQIDCNAMPFTASLRIDVFQE
jgi:hypothetical protein